MCVFKSHQKGGVANRNWHSWHTSIFKLCLEYCTLNSLVIVPINHLQSGYPIDILQSGYKHQLAALTEFTPHASDCIRAYALWL